MLERDKKTQKRYAFLMGANGPFNQHLKYAEKDVERLAKALTGDLCAFTSVVSNIAIEAQGTLLHLQNFCQICEPSDLLVVHFSGNARVDQNLYLICNNTDHDSLIGSSIDIRQIKDILRTCRAQKKLLILDCSHAGIAHAGGGLNDSPKVENTPCEKRYKEERVL